MNSNLNSINMDITLNSAVKDYKDSIRKILFCIDDYTENDIDLLIKMNEKFTNMLKAIK